MKIDLDDQASIASAASPGRWRAGADCSSTGTAVLRDVGDDLYEVADRCSPEDAAHIAANSPPVTLALIARIRELEAVLKRCGNAFCEMESAPKASELIRLLEKPPRLTRAREMAGLSLAQAAKLLGWQRDHGVTTLADLESGKREPATSLLNALADLYDVQVEWLRGDDLVLRPETEMLLRSVENTTDRETLRDLLIATQGRPQ